MSIIIKGMEMPEDCRDCPMCGYECDIGRTRCIIEGRILAEHYKSIPFDGRPEWCPLIELLPHGRLIDADRLLMDRMKSKYYHLPNGDTAIPIIDIEHAPTVLEAEDKE